MGSPTQVSAEIRSGSTDRKILLAAFLGPALALGVTPAAIIIFGAQSVIWIFAAAFSAVALRLGFVKIPDAVRPGPVEVFVGGYGGGIFSGALLGLITLAGYGLMSISSALLHVLGIPYVQKLPQLFSDLVLGSFGLGFVLTTVEMAADQWYGGATGAYPEFHKKVQERAWAKVALVAGGILSLLVAGALAWKNSLWLCVTAQLAALACTASVMDVGAREQSTSPAPAKSAATKVVADLLTAAGYKISTPPADNSLLVGLDMIAYREQVALAVQVMVASSSEPISRRQVPDLRAAAYEYWSGVADSARRDVPLRLVLFLIGASITDSFRRMVIAQSMMVFQFSTDEFQRLEKPGENGFRQQQVDALRTLSSIDPPAQAIITRGDV